jgi:phthalate 4,5-cis-dihydrodiol dehydrogenase
MDVEESPGVRPLRYGIAGIGVGAGNLLEAVRQNPRVQIVAAADVRSEPLERFGSEFGVRTFTSVEEMCRYDEVDVIWVATPNHLHAEHVVAAAEQEKHVIVSKPMALTLIECQQMVDAADKYGVQLLAGHSQGMAPAVLAVARTVLSGELGTLGMINSWHHSDWMYRPREPRELDQKRGGGVVFRQSPHHIDIIRLIGGGALRSVRATTLDLQPGRRGTGAFSAWFTFANGVPATLVYSGYGHFDTSELTSVERIPKGFARAVTAEQELQLKEARRYNVGETLGREAAREGHSLFGLTIVSCERGDLRQSGQGYFVYQDGGRREVAVPTQRRGDAEFDEMFDAVVHGKPILHDGRWGMATQEALLGIIESASEQREVQLHHQTSVAVQDLPAPRADD